MPVSCQALGLTMIRANSSLWNSTTESCKRTGTGAKNILCVQYFHAIFFIVGESLDMLKCWRLCHPGKQANMDMRLKVNHS